MNNLSEILAVLAASYPNYTLTKETISVYGKLLSDIPIEFLQAGALKHATENKWFPSVAELRESSFAVMLNKPGIPSAYEAWEEVQKEMKRCGNYWAYQTTKYPEWSNPLVEKAVNVMGYKNMYLSDNQMADRAHFFKVYEGLMTRAEEEVKRLPAVANKMIESGIKQLADKLGG